MITSPLFWAVLFGAALVSRLLPRYRDWIVVVASAAYLLKEDWRSVIVVTALAGLSYAATHYYSHTAKWTIPVLVAVALLYLGLYKYYPPLRDAILGVTPPVGPAPTSVGPIEARALVPIGASYFTFKLIHYLVDSSRGQIPKHEPQTFVGYMLFLPMFAAGPIQRFDEYLANRSDKATKRQLAEGIGRIIEGLIKKTVIVDLVMDQRFVHNTKNLLFAIPFSRPPCTVEQLLRESHTIHPFFTWQFVIHTATQWYLDFSAYSDIAIGGGLLFGIQLTENFRWPYFAPNPTDYWKRYHISLSAFCQRYVYLPVMGFTRNPYVAVYATMMTMGLWHSGNLNYLAWGAWHATILAIFLTWGRIKRAMKWKWKSRALLVVGTIATALAACASAVFPATSTAGLGAAFRLLVTLVGIHL